MTATAASVRRADPTDAVQVAGLIATAFAPLAVSRWLVPDTAARETVLPRYFRLLVDHALDKAGGVVYVVDGQATAVWVPWTEAGPPPEPEDYQARLAEICGPWASRFGALDALFAEHHPSTPHHHLEFLAVRPGLQGTGLGSRLLDWHHQLLDSAGWPAYLEAASPSCRALYARKGYDEYGAGMMELPGGPPLWAMWRPGRRLPAPTAPYRRAGLPGVD